MSASTPTKCLHSRHGKPERCSQCLLDTIYVVRLAPGNLPSWARGDTRSDERRAKESLHRGTRQRLEIK